MLAGVRLAVIHSDFHRGDTPNANMADLSVGPGLVAQKRG